MRINKLESLVPMSDPPPHTKRPPSAPPPSLSPTTAYLPPTSRFPKTLSPGHPPPDPLTILGIFLIIAIAAYALHVLLWIYFPPDAITPNEIDIDIRIGTAGQRRPRVGRRLQWGTGSSCDSNHLIREEEEDREEGERHELSEMRKPSVEEDEEEGSLRPRGYDAYTEDDDGDEHAERARFIMLPRHIV